MTRTKRSGDRPPAKTSSKRSVSRADALVKNRRFLGSELRDGLCQELASISFSCQNWIQRMELVCEQSTKSLGRVCDKVLAALAEARAIADELDATASHPDHPTCIERNRSNL